MAPESGEHSTLTRSEEATGSVTAEQIADQLHARRSGAGWIGRCPAHEDRSPSLSIREGDDGRVLLHCFAGCSIESICEAVGLKVSYLFPESRTIPSKPHIVREDEKQITDLRSRLTRRERGWPITLVETDDDHVDHAIVRALALAVVHQEIVQVVLK